MVERRKRKREGRGRKKSGRGLDGEGRRGGELKDRGGKYLATANALHRGTGFKVSFASELVYEAIQRWIHQIENFAFRIGIPVLFLIGNAPFQF
jgi:hypothetical protein